MEYKFNVGDKVIIVRNEQGFKVSEDCHARIYETDLYYYHPYTIKKCDWEAGYGNRYCLEEDSEGLWFCEKQLRRVYSEEEIKQSVKTEPKQVNLCFVRYEDNPKLYVFNNPTDELLEVGTKVLANDNKAIVVSSIKLNKEYLDNLKLAIKGNNSNLLNIEGVYETVERFKPFNNSLEE